jgi:8-oxo-dGTP pyrophosphatase MutT (NUDIX family)
MTDEPVEIIYAGDRMRRVVIFRRPSGTFGYREERHYKNELAGTEAWASVGGHACHYEDLETAKREVVENVPWLAKQKSG